MQANWCRSGPWAALALVAVACDLPARRSWMRSFAAVFAPKLRAGQPQLTMTNASTVATGRHLSSSDYTAFPAASCAALKTQDLKISASGMRLASSKVPIGEAGKYGIRDDWRSGAARFRMHGGRPSHLQRQAAVLVQSCLSSSPQNIRIRFLAKPHRFAHHTAFRPRCLRHAVGTSRVPNSGQDKPAATRREIACAGPQQLLPSKENSAC